MSGTVQESVVLPNGDIWRPRYTKDPKGNVSAVGVSDEPPSPMEQIGDRTDCPWCGMECSTKPALQTHVRVKHQSALDGRDELERQAAIAAAFADAG